MMNLILLLAVAVAVVDAVAVQLPGQIPLGGGPSQSRRLNGRFLHITGERSPGSTFESRTSLANW